MELRYYLKILQKYWRSIAVVSVALAVLVGVGGYYWPTRYRSQLAVYVQRVPDTPQAGDYSYDGYYAQQTAEAYTDTVEGFLQSREIIRQALELAELPTSAKQIRYVEKRLKVEKVAPQIINVTIVMDNQERASQLVKTMAEATQIRVKTLNREKNEAMVVGLLDSRPLESEIKPWVGLNIVVAFFAGLIMATTGVFLWEYLRE